MKRIPMYRAFVGAALLVMTLACRSTPQAEARWQEGPVPAANPDMLFELVRLALERQRFPILGGFDPNTRHLETGWDIQLAPFRGRGYREKAHVTYEPAREGGGYELDVRVQRDVNMALANPLDLSYAEWKPGADHEERARLILRHVQQLAGTPAGALRGGSPSPNETR